MKNLDGDTIYTKVVTFVKIYNFVVHFLFEIILMLK
jgi:hypothetical protein